MAKHLSPVKTPSPTPSYTVHNLKALGEEIVYELPADMEEMRRSSLAGKNNDQPNDDQTTASQFVLKRKKSSRRNRKKNTIPTNNNDSKDIYSLFNEVMEATANKEAEDRVVPEEPQKNSFIPREPYKIEKTVLSSPGNGKSVLTAMMERKAALNNPLSALYAGFVRFDSLLVL